MGVSDTFRKWWHIILSIEDRNGSGLTTMTSIDPSNVNSNADSNITARSTNCTGTVSVPPRAWHPTHSPGFFILRPDVIQLESAFKNIDSYSQIINVDNRRIFRYTLKIAYNDLDGNCNTITPRVMDPDDIDVSVETIKSIVFRIPEMEFLDSLSCCDITLSDIPDLLPEPGDINECTRLWYIVNEGSVNHLYSYDVSDASIVDRGIIRYPFGGGSYQLTYYDIAWDNRNFLWGLEQGGLTRLLVGESGIPAYAMEIIDVENPFSSVASIFPIEHPTNPAQGAMSFNQNTNKMYIFCNRRLWELQAISDSSWEVTQVSYEFGENEMLGDLAFGPDGRCYCFYNNKLATIDVRGNSSLFGFITYVQDGGSFTNFVGIDFVATADSSSQASLYAIRQSGQIYIVDPDTANKILVSGDSIGDIALGLSSCQAGEDLRTLPFPFYPGASPWLFIICTSSSMAGEKLERLQNTLVDFVSSYVRFGDELSIMKFDTTFFTFGPRIMQNTNDSEDASDFISNLTSSGQSNFCAAFTEAANPVVFRNIRSVVVISDGQFTDCGSVQDDVNNNLNVLWSAIKVNNPQAILYSVGILPDNDASLIHLGDIGGGGYVKWD